MSNYPPPKSPGIGTGVKIGIGIVIGFLLMMGACAACFVYIGNRALNQNSNVSLSKPASSANAPKTSDPDLRYVQIDKALNFNGLALTVVAVVIGPDRILVKLTLKNNTDQKLTFYPTQGNAVIGNVQLDADYSGSESHMSGDIMPGVQKTGNVGFLAPKNQTIPHHSVKNIELNFGKIFNENYKTTQCTIKLSL
jgi:hypothetical protein